MALSTNERQRRFKERRYAMGMKRFHDWCYTEDEGKIKAYIRRLNKKHEKVSRKQKKR